MGRLEDRLRRLEEQLVLAPSVQDYLDARNREQVRALHVLAERLAPYGFGGDYLFTDANRQMLSDDTPEQQEQDKQLIDAWYRAQGKDRATEAEGARERLLAKLEVRS